MNQLAVPTVEIFRDLDDAPADIAPALAGIAMVSEIAGRLDVVNTKRSLRLGYAPGTPIDNREIRWPAFAADFNLVLTGKELVGNEAIADTRPVGRAYVTNIGPQAAVVSMAAPLAEQTAAHELGHMFGLKNIFDESTEDTHCDKVFCIMFPVRDIVDYEVPRSRALPGRWLERLGIVRREHDVEPRSSLLGFCDGCTADLRQLAVARFMVKNGLKLPDSIY